MHELSIIYSILETAETEVKKQAAPCSVDAIELEIGDLAGVEVSTLEFLWPAAVENTVLAQAACLIRHTSGEANCSQCGTTFQVHQYYDPCPYCGSHLIRVTKGEELRIKSLTLTT